MLEEKWLRPGDVGPGGKRISWGLHDWIFKNLRTIMGKTRFVPGGPEGQS